MKVKGKVVPVFNYFSSTTPWRRMGEWMYRSIFSWNSALAVGEWSASRHGRFTPGEKVPGTHWIGGWVGPRAGLDDVEKRKFLTLPGLELRLLGHPGRSQSLYRLSYPGSVVSHTYMYIREHKLCISNLSLFGQETGKRQVLTRRRTEAKVSYSVDCSLCLSASHLPETLQVM
jgi:hypothetical protein